MMKHLKTLPTYIFLVVVLGVFSQFPVFDHAPSGKAMVKLTMSLYGDRAEACRELSAEEIEKLPHNMKRTKICGRKRSPIYVEVFDGKRVLFAQEIPPSGLGKDGPSVIYESYWVDVGDHVLTVNVRNTSRQEGFDWTLEQHVSLSEYQHLIIDFRKNEGVVIR